MQRHQTKSRRRAVGYGDTSPDNVGLHLKGIYAEGELDEAATAEEFPVVRQEGGRSVRRVHTSVMYFK
jgi:hypothetical protein